MPKHSWTPHLFGYGMHDDPLETGKSLCVFRPSNQLHPERMGRIWDWPELVQEQGRLQEASERSGCKMRVMKQHLRHVGST
jgi:hypothetical protein